MSKSQRYTQCKLERKGEGTSTLTQTAWIPSEFAKVGKRIQLKQADAWQDGWSVTATFSSQDGKALLEQRAAHKQFAEVLQDHH